MSLLFQDEEQRLLKHPVEIWNTILHFCLEPTQAFASTSRKAIGNVLAVSSKEFNKLVRKILGVDSQEEAKAFGRSRCGLAEYCSANGYVSLLRYALDNGAVIRGEESSLAVQNGNLDCLKVLEDRGEELTVYLLNDAAHGRHEEIVQYLINKGVRPSPQTIKSAIGSGRVDLLKYLQNYIKLDNYEDFGVAAALSGNLEMVKYIEQFTPLERKNMIAIHQSGSIEVLKYYIDKGFALDDPQMCSTALRNGHVKYVKFAMSHGAPLNKSVMQEAVKLNDIELMKELRTRGCPWDGSVIKEAATSGSLEALKFLIENGCPYDVEKSPRQGFNFGPSFGFDATVTIQNDATTCAARNGHISCLKYLMEHGAPWPENIINETVHRNNIFNMHVLDTVQYLRERGCSWNATTCQAAASRGDLKLLKYLHQNGCPWDEETCSSAVAFKNIPCLLYALDNGCPANDDTMNTATYAESLEIIQILFERGVPWTKMTCAVSMQLGNYEVLKYAHENGAPWTEETMTIALRARWLSLPCFIFAVKNGCPWSPQEVLASAQRFNNMELVEWIQNNAMNN